jgi:serine/threonine protein kinase
MDRATALRLLGLQPGSKPEDILTAHDQKAAVSQAHLERAAVPKLRQQFEAALFELAAARDLLLSSTPRGLSATKLADLPIAGPMGSASDGMASDAAQQGMATALRPGQVLCQRYELQARIGVGGMGEVFKALDRVRGEEIAIKVLLPHLLQHPTALQRFAAEAKISIELAHPNIVNVFDLQREAGYGFLTMELLHGRSLRDWMAHRAETRTPFSVDEVLQLAQAVGSALDYAHRKTVHRDVKPENIWVCEGQSDGAQYKLMDFGIARLMSNSQMNQTRTAMGTAYYMAPEQLLPGVDVDGRADQFSLAVVLYELLAGEKPLGRAKSLNERDRRVPKGLSMAIDKALSPRPHERYPTMAAFLDALKTRSASLKSPAVLMGGAGGVMLVGLLAFTFPTWSEWVPLPGRTAEARNRAIQSQGVAEALIKRIEAREREIDGALRDARNQVDRLESSARTTRTDSERLEVASRIAVARRVQREYEEIKALAASVVFSPDALGRVRGQVNIGAAALRDNRTAPAAQAMAEAQREAERLMALSEQISNAVKSRVQAEAVLQGLEQLISSDGVTLDLTSFRAALEDARDQITKGQYAEARDRLTELRRQQGATLNAELDRLISRYSQLAERATASDDLGVAEQALRQVKRLTALKL